MTDTRSTAPSDAELRAAVRAIPRAQLWRQGAPTLAVASELFPFSRSELFRLIGLGILPSKRYGGKGTNCVPWAALVAIVELLPDRDEKMEQTR